MLRLGIPLRFLQHNLQPAGGSVAWRTPPITGSITSPSQTSPNLHLLFTGLSLLPLTLMLISALILRWFASSTVLREAITSLGSTNRTDVSDRILVNTGFRKEFSYETFYCPRRSPRHLGSWFGRCFHHQGVCGGPRNTGTAKSELPAGLSLWHVHAPGVQHRWLQSRHHRLRWQSAAELEQSQQRVSVRCRLLPECPALAEVSSSALLGFNPSRVCLSGKCIERFEGTGEPQKAGILRTCLLCCRRSFPQRSHHRLVERLVPAVSGRLCSQLGERKQNCYHSPGLPVKGSSANNFHSCGKPGIIKE